MIGHIGGDPRKAICGARFAVPVALVALALLALPAVARAANCQPLPGRSALDQYCESVPGAGGDKAARGGKRSGGAGGGGRGDGSSLPPGVADRLRDAGPGGEALLDYARTSGSGAVGGSGKSGKAGRGGAGQDGTKGPEADSSNNPFSAIKNAVSSGPSAGPVYLWVLIAIALIVAALGWLRYRARHGAGAE